MAIEGVSNVLRVQDIQKIMRIPNMYTATMYGHPGIPSLLNPIYADARLIKFRTEYEDIVRAINMIERGCYTRDATRRGECTGRVINLII